MKKLFENKYLVEILKVIVVLVIILIAFAFWLGYYGRHDQDIPTPDLAGLTASQAIERLENQGFRWEIMDSSRYESDKKPREILSQDPIAGTGVKEGRKIYFKINRSSYESVLVPRIDFENDKLSNVSKRLIASGFTIGQITYEPHIAQDVVLGISVRGRSIHSGIPLPKNTAIDILVGQSENNSELIDSTLVDDEDF